MNQDFLRFWSSYWASSHQNLSSKILETSEPVEIEKFAFLFDRFSCSILLFTISPSPCFHLHALDFPDSLSRTIHHKNKSLHLELVLVTIPHACWRSVSISWVWYFCTFAYAALLCQDDGDHFSKNDPVRSSDDLPTNSRILTLLHACYRHPVLFRDDSSFFVLINLGWVHVHLETFAKKDLCSTQYHPKGLPRAVPVLGIVISRLLWISSFLFIFSFFFVSTLLLHQILKKLQNSK